MADPIINGRWLMRTALTLFMKLFTRTTISGQENIPSQGPLLVVGNHASTIDAPLMMMALPMESARFVGPGDFKLLFPANLVLDWAGVIQVKRSTQMERSALKQMTDVLKEGHILALFPEGGTWEKPLFNAKQGAAYLSMTTGAPILPIGIGGNYRSWYEVARLRRPRLTVNIGKVMPAVQQPADRHQREGVLQQATQDMMQRIYDLLPTEDKARYDDWARRTYHLTVDVWRGEQKQTVNLTGGEILGELMLKPNLFSPFIHNAHLPITPLQYGGVNFPATAVETAAKSMLGALGDQFSDYFEYRLGLGPSQQIRTALQELQQLAGDPQVTQLALCPSSSLP